MRKMALTVSVTALILFLVLPPFVIPTVSSNGASWLGGWGYRKAHAIISTNSHTGTDYQTKIIVHFGSGTDNRNEVYCNNRCKTDFGDIRFTDSDGVTEFDYWIEEKEDSNFAVFWVELACNLLYNSTVIYMYYGKNDATTSSNGEATFIYFDDFESGSINYGKWDVYGTSPNDTVSIVDDPAGGTNKVLKIHESGDGNATGVITSEWEPMSWVSIGVKWRRSADYDKWQEYMYARIFKADNQILFSECVYFDGNYHKWHAGSTHTDYKPAFSTTANAWNKIEYRTAGADMEVYFNDTIHYGGFDPWIALDWPRKFSPLQFAEYEEDRDAFIDNVYVRKWGAYPLHGAWGSEESSISPTPGWPMFRHDLANTGNSNTTGPEQPMLIWRYQTTDAVLSSPVVAGVKIFVGSQDSYLYCLDKDQGYLIWRYQTGYSVFSSPAVVDERVYVGSKDSYVYCLDADDGSLVWRFQTGGEIHSSPAISGDKLYIGSDDNYVYCLNASTGTQIWRYRTGFRVWSSPAVADNRVYVGSHDDYVYCLDANSGNRIWRRQLGSWVYSSPAVVDGRVYVASYHPGNVYCLNKDDGSQIWQYQTQGEVISSAAVADDKVFIGSYDNHTYCLNATTGGQIWNHTTSAEIFSSPSVAEDRIYVASFDYYVYCLDEDNGSLVWRYQTQGLIESSPTLVDGKLYIGSSDGIYCIGEGIPSSDVVPPSIIYMNYWPKDPTDIDSVRVVAEVWDESGISSVELSYNNGSGWASIVMPSVGGITYEAKIPAQPVGTQVSFQIEANDTLGNTFWSSIFTYDVEDTTGGEVDFTIDVTDTLNVMLHVHCNQPINVNIEAVGMPGVPSPQFIVLYTPFSITANISLGFAISIIYNYSDELLPLLGIDESTLAFYYWNAADNSWNELSTTANTASNELTATIDHLTIFAVFGQAIDIDIGDGFSWPLMIAAVVLIVFFALSVLGLRFSRSRVRWGEHIIESATGPTEEEAIPEEIAPEPVEPEEPRPLPISELSCSYCGHQNPSGASFCVKCGRHLGEFHS